MSLDSLYGPEHSSSSTSTAISPRRPVIIPDKYLSYFVSKQLSLTEHQQQNDRLTSALSSKIKSDGTSRTSSRSNGSTTSDVHSKIFHSHNLATYDPMTNSYLEDTDKNTNLLYNMTSQSRNGNLSSNYDDDQEFTHDGIKLKRKVRKVKHI